MKKIRYMKQFTNIIFLSAMIFLSASGFAQTFFSTNTGDTIWYYFVNGNVFVNQAPSGSNLYSGDIVIPDTVSYNGRTYNVTGVNHLAFALCSGLTSITLPHTITNMYSNVFYACTNLVKTNFTGTLAQWCNIYFNDSGSNPIFYSKNLYINDTLITHIRIPGNTGIIGQYAFMNDTALLDVMIDSGVSEIKARAFKNCRNMHTVTLGKTITNIVNTAFDSCKSLTYTGFSGNYKEWCNINFGGLTANPVYYSKNLYINSRLVTSLTIPNNVQQIKNYAFVNCQTLTSVVFGDSVKRIGDYVFYGCSSIASLTFDTLLRAVGSRSFQSCTSLTTITIPKSLDTLGGDAFYSCSGIRSTYYTGTLEDWCRIIFMNRYSNPMVYSRNLYINNRILSGSLVIPPNITKVGSYPFENCNAITSVVMHDSISFIGSSAFENCTNIASVTFPDSIFFVGASAFQNCLSMVPARFPTKISFIGDYAFANCKRLDISIPASTVQIGASAFSGCSSLRKAVISDNTTTVGREAFMDCTLLDTASIGNSVTIIPQNLFKNDTALRYVSLGSSVSQIRATAFDGCNHLQTTNYTGTVGKWCEITFGDNPVAISHNLYLNGQPLTDVVIPNTIYQIPANAFKNDTLITMLTFGSNVNGINRQSFTGCKNIGIITFKKLTSPVVDQQAFDLPYSSNIIPRIPCGSSYSYSSNQTLSLWFRNFFERMVFSFDVRSGDQAKGTVSITQQPGCNRPAQFTAVPRSGCTFTHWSDGDTNSTRSMYITSDTDLTAFFSGTSGINHAEYDGGAIQYSEGTIVINTLRPQHIMISDALGRVLFSGKCDGYMPFKTKNKGLYFVKIGDSPARKIVIDK
ncbi:MAG: leucine-rich repeat domain-containing protein [Bacteroidales bacterium]|nr:leucine-rich repeat domain-containing protein [Bacteroidales bacterium]